MKIPRDSRWTQLNNGNLHGILNETEQITLDKEGFVKLSRKPFALYTSDDDVNLALPRSITYFNDSYFVLTDDECFEFDTGGGGLTQKAGTGKPNFAANGDAMVAYGRYTVSVDNQVHYYDGTSWTSYGLSLDSAKPHPLAVFDSLTTYKLCVGNGRAVQAIDNAGNVLDNSGGGSSLLLPDEYQITTMAYRNGYLYIGTKHLYGGEAKVFIWDGNTVNANSEVPVGAAWIFSIIPYKQTVACITNEGQLLALTGNTTTQMAALPVYYDPNAQWQGSGGLTYGGKVLHRGMVAVGDTIYISLDGEVDSEDMPSMKSGVWVYDSSSGLNHRAYSTSDKFVSDVGLSVASSTLTLSANHNLKYGDAVQFTGVDGLVGVTTGVKYYVSVQDTDQIKLAKSRKALKAGNYVTITGTPTASDDLVYMPNTDWSSSTSYAQGAITQTTHLESNLDMWATSVLWGARIRDVDSNTLYTVNGLSDSWNIGRLTTQRIYTGDVTQTWKKVVTFLEGCHLSNEEVLVKVKSSGEIGYPTNIFRGDWTSATTIDSTASTLDEDEWNDIEDGDEITIVDGAGRGYTTHVSGTPSESGGVWTVTVDESIGTNTKPVNFYVDKFKKIKAYDNTRETVDYILSVLSSIKSPWIQIKLELRGFETEISMFDLISSADKRAI